MVLFCAVAASAQAQLDPFAPPPGTYKHINVGSAEDCRAFCRNEGPKCRGSFTVSTSTRASIYECYLNDGRTEGSPFIPKPPTPLDPEVAVSDLNAYRAKHGLGPVTLQDQLNEASDAHARDLAKHGFLGHEGSDGSSHADRLWRTGYEFGFAGENVASGQKSWESVFEGWQRSPGHNENLLDPDAVHFGIALVFEPNSDHATYWAMLVAKPLS